MMAIYVDASAVVRLLFHEPGVRAPVHRSDVVVSSDVVAIEVARVLDRARLEGLVDDAELARKSSELQAILRRLHLFPLAPEMVEVARSSFPVQCRAVDAIHVATAQLVSQETPSLEFWTHDPMTAAAAAVRGLEVQGLSRA